MRSLSFLSTIFLLIVCSNGSFASIGGSHTCSSADGAYTIDLLFDPDKSLYHKGADKALPYTVLNKVLIEKTIEACKSKASNKMLYRYKITGERYLMQIDSRSEGKMFMYCESYVDPSPATACDSNSYDKTIYHKELDPKY